MSRPDALLLYVLLIVTIFVVALAQDCAYTIKIQTGTRDSSGTDSVIRVIIADKSGQYIEIKDLETWGGKMPPGHDYFENGNLDIFSGKERCLPSPVCFLTLNSNGSGNKPGWYVEYVNVTTDKKGSPSKRQHFGVQQWLALDEPPYELSTERNNCQKDRKGMIIGISVSGFVLLTFFIASLMVFLKRKKKAEETANLITSINEDLERGAGPRKFTYNDLAAAANNFSDDRKLGKGGFGAVYRGYLNSLDMMVAIKKFGGGSNQGRREFITEVKIISSLRHRNLVQLIGWCHEKDEFLMIYELMPNGSLDTHLFGKKPHLAWPVRCKITLGLASALLYLHEEWEQCVVHRDIKASNVLLDSNFNAKLGDFGLARLMDHELGPQTTGLAGTFGYMSPEYISTGRASKESDVYSFGVVTLEIVTGRKSVDPRQGRVEPETSLVEKVWDLYGKGEVVTAIDEKLRVDGFDEKQAECLMVIGLWCAHPDRNSRPSIKQAIQVLNLEAPLPRLPTEMPVATYQVSSSTTTSVSSGGATATFSSVQLGHESVGSEIRKSLYSIL